MNFSDIERNLQQNQHISEDIKKIVYENYYDIYQFLGKRDFLKWVDRERLTLGIRNIIFQTLTEKEDKYLRENPNVLGYHIGPSGPYNKENIVLRRGIKDYKDVNAHEAFHSLADGLGGFNRFWGEGITEFLNKTMYSKSTYSYPKNVEMVYLAYSMFGNIILKDYFQKKGDKFFFHLSKSADDERFQIMMETGARINNRLEEYYYTIYKEKSPKSAQFKKADLALKNGIVDLLSFYYMKKQVDIERFRHIKSDKIDFNGFINEQADILKYLKVLDTNRKEYKDIYKQFDFIRKQLIEKMVRNSHFVFNKSEEEQQEIINKVTKDVDSRILSRVSGKYLSIEETYINQNVEEPYRSLNENVTGRLVVSFLYTDDCKDFLSTIRRIADIQSATTEFPTKEIVDTLKVMSGNLGNKRAIAILGNAQTFARNIENISELERQYECDLETPSFKKIQIDGLEEINTYVEFNDRKQFLVLIDKEKGILDRISLNDYSSVSPEFNIYATKNSVTNSSDITSCEIGLPNMHKLTHIKIDSKAQDVVIEGGKATQGLIGGVEAIYEDVLSSVTFKTIEGDIQRGLYSHGMSQEQEVISTVRISEEARSIDIDDFIQDYSDVKKLIPGLDKYNEVFGSLSEKLIDTTFESHLIPEGTPAKQQYEKQKGIMIFDMKRLLCEKQKGTNTADIEAAHERLNSDLDNLNKTVDQAVPRNNAGILVGRGENKSQFLKKAVFKTRENARSSAIRLQAKKIEVLKRGLPGKTNDIGMRDGYGDI